MKRSMQEPETIEMRMGIVIWVDFHVEVSGGLCSLILEKVQR